MTTTPSIAVKPIANRLRVSAEQVRRTATLLDDGNTAAFIARYRKDETGGLNDEQIRSVERGVAQARMLAERKASVLKLIDSQGKLTSALRKRIESAKSSKRLEDLYLPYKSDKQSLASLARQRGLEPLADEMLSDGGCDIETRAVEFLSPDNELSDVADVVTGVTHIIAERFSERTDVRARLREIFARTGQLICTKQEAINESLSKPAAASGSSEESPSDSTATTDSPKETPKLSVRQRKRNKLEHSLRDYFDYRESVGKVRPHRVLAINRGERAKVIRVRVEAASDSLTSAAAKMLVDDAHPNSELLGECVRNALSRFVVPSLEREIRRELSEAAETHAVSVFAKNLRKLFLQRPVHGRRILAVDPGFKNGCNLAAIDEFGAVLQHETIFLIGDEEQRRVARGKIVEFVTTHDLSVIAIGNGAACRDAEQLVAAAINDELKDRGVEYVIVNEAGASVYSTSAIGREELPNIDATIRSAISIARRLLDPLSELVKINPANIGVGMYQHDVKAKHLRASLDAVVESCVNFVGVDVNTASPALLSYVSGLNQLTARRLYEYRLEHGPFRNREQIRDVPGIGDSTFVQAAGFLRITGGDNPFDATWIHPESYGVAEQVLQRLGSDVDELVRILSPDDPASGIVSFDERAAKLQLDELAAEFGVGEMSLHDIIDALANPGRDPRDDLPAPTFRSGIIKIDDIDPGMELTGTVLNVVDFGAFVDIGISDTSLVHISRLADRYVRDPHEIVSIGDVLQVWVLEVDRERRRVLLTAISPGKRSQRENNSKKKTEPRPKRQVTNKKANRPHATGPQKSGPQKSGPRRPKYKSASRQSTPAKKRQPAKPITQKMVQGTEPMRTFSDLIQYYEVKQQDDSDKTSGN